MAEDERYGMNFLSTDDSVTVVSISDSKSSLVKLDDHLKQKDILRKCSVFHHRKAPRFFKNLQRFATYEDVIVLVNGLNAEKTKWLTSTLYSYRSVKSILVLSVSKTDDLQHEEARNKTIDIFHDYPSMSSYVEKLLDQIEKESSDQDAFIIYNRPQKALKDLREHLGSFIWTNTVRCMY